MTYALWALLPLPFAWTAIAVWRWVSMDQDRAARKLEREGRRQEVSLEVAEFRKRLGEAEDKLQALAIGRTQLSRIVR